MTEPDAAPRPPDRSAARRLLATGGVLFGVLAPASYIAMRLYERARHPLVDPSAIVLSRHPHFPWRALLASWWALLCAVIVLAAMGGSRLELARAERLGARLVRAAVLLTVLFALAAWRFA